MLKDAKKPGKTIGFYHGALCDRYEKQANEQEYTLGEKAELFDKIGDAYNLLRIHGILSDSESDNVCKRLQKKLVNSVKIMNGDGNDGN